MFMHRSFKRPPRKTIPFNGNESSPMIIVMDVTWVDYHFDHTNFFYNKFPPRDIIEVVAHIPTYVDYDSAIVDEMENRFNINEQELLDLHLTELLVTNVITMFYENLQECIPDSIESYIFKQWVDFRRNDIVLVRQDTLSRLP